jgi:hypothetical protein
MTCEISTYTCLQNASVTMAEAGDFAWAVGRLLQQVSEAGEGEYAISNAVVAGLGQGLKIVGAHLNQEVAEYRKLLHDAPASTVVSPTAPPRASDTEASQ